MTRNTMPAGALGRPCGGNLRRLASIALIIGTISLLNAPLASSNHPTNCSGSSTPVDVWHLTPGSHWAYDLGGGASITPLVGSLRIYSYVDDGGSCFLSHTSTVPAGQTMSVSCFGGHCGWWTVRADTPSATYAYESL